MKLKLSNNIILNEWEETGASNHISVIEFKRPCIKLREAVYVDVFLNNNGELSSNRFNYHLLADDNDCNSNTEKLEYIQTYFRKIINEITLPKSIKEICDWADKLIIQADKLKTFI